MIQIPEGALDELFTGGRFTSLFIREHLKTIYPEAMIDVPAAWFQRGAWNGTTTIKSKNLPKSTRGYGLTHRQAFGKESNMLMLSRHGFVSNALRFKANYEGWLSNPDTKKNFSNLDQAPTWAEIEIYAQIMFDEFDLATQNYMAKKLIPILP